MKTEIIDSIVDSLFAKKAINEEALKFIVKDYMKDSTTDSAEVIKFLLSGKLDKNEINISILENYALRYNKDSKIEILKYNYNPLTHKYTFEFNRIYTDGSKRYEIDYMSEWSYDDALDKLKANETSPVEEYGNY